MKEQLFWDKYRPKNYKHMILLPRIKSVVKELVENNLFANFIFVGDAGMGKTTIASIIAEKYKSQCMIVKANGKIGVDLLWGEMATFCRSVSGGFGTGNTNEFKLIYIDEIETASAAFISNLRAFIEKYSNDVRFICTCNSIENIPNPILDRFQVIDFNPQSNEEVEYLKMGYLKWMLNLKNKLNIENVEEDWIKESIEWSFPSFRKLLDIFNAKIHNPDFSFYGLALTQMDEFYELIINDKIKSEEIFHYLKLEYKNDKNLTASLGNWLEWLIKKNPHYVNKLGMLAITIAKYQNWVSQAMDIKLNLFACIIEIRMILEIE